ncbi:hypothetical protein QJS10_CPA03g02380 [Acorus calamus]|uniref:Uncharacterized protein n=1 Tax=Acorus calamus TaxID=4465 RepID=A0AAV9F558_ACOCL|nr:hypothetical protein QJS10_CPA03g02380 [Acorus calamus]
MINSKRLIAMAKKWQRLAALGRRRLLSTSTATDRCVDLADKGHFIVYTTDERRFMIPLAYLKNNIFRELFRMSENLFGFPSDGHITLPCDAAFMEYVMSLLGRRISRDVEKALLMSITTGRCSGPSVVSQCHTCQPLLLLHGF